MSNRNKDLVSFEQIGKAISATPAAAKQWCIARGVPLVGDKRAKRAYVTRHLKAEELGRLSASAS